ncbi:MAG: chorismate transformation enzyme, FkbO/Hyg5 family [Nitrospiraceae bacterium]
MTVKSTSTPRSFLADRRVSEAVARLDVGYIEPEKLQSQLARAGVLPMAIISFGHALPRTFCCPVVVLDLPQLDGPPLIEVWTCDQPTQTQEEAGCSIVMNGDFLIGSISLVEPPGVSLDVTAYAGYRKVFHKLRDIGYPYLWRAWNYFPRINDDQDSLERYRRFCVGRHQALIETLSDFPSSLPAGTAVGTRSGPFQIVFLAGRQPATHLGNPRQLNAYEYPQDYGPCSPSFARATFIRSEGECLLFLAGTASVVGHRSRHIGLPIEQTRETIQNVRAVLTHAEHVAGIDLTEAQHQAIYKVYVRDSDSLSEIRRVLKKSPLCDDQILFLHGDLCRKELLVEIEGLIISD